VIGAVQRGPKLESGVFGVDKGIIPGTMLESAFEGARSLAAVALDMMLFSTSSLLRSLKGLTAGAGASGAIAGSAAAGSACERKS